MTSVLTSSFCIFSVFASRDTRKNNDHAFETRSRSRRKNRDRNGLEIYQKDFRLDVPIRSAPASPFSSPTLSPHRRSAGDLLPHINPMGNQVWYTPEIPTSDMNPGLPPPAFSDYSIVSNDNSPVHSPSNRSPCRNPRSPPGSTSPLHTKLSIEVSTSRREGNGYGEVHPLPLPPGASLSLPSPQALLTPKPESQPVKGQWIKGKLIGRGTFGSVYVATNRYIQFHTLLMIVSLCLSKCWSGFLCCNRETGALCAMKEVELFPDDPKSAECIKQLQQVIIDMYR